MIEIEHSTKKYGNNCLSHGMIYDIIFQYYNIQIRFDLLPFWYP